MVVSRLNPAWCHLSGFRKFSGKLKFFLPIYSRANLQWTWLSQQICSLYPQFVISVIRFSACKICQKCTGQTYTFRFHSNTKRHTAHANLIDGAVMTRKRGTCRASASCHKFRFLASLPPFEYSRANRNGECWNESVANLVNLLKSFRHSVCGRPGWREGDTARASRVLQHHVCARLAYCPSLPTPTH